MKLEIFSIYDSKSEAYMQPFFMKNKGEATRAFTTLCNDGQSQMHQYPEDFTLFSLGAYDDSTGGFHQEKTPNPIGKATEFKKEN
ncbi:nonstructural protein [Microviridae sp.]|nr:nonstructural protein [Microviridae sp.]